MSRLQYFDDMRDCAAPSRKDPRRGRAGVGAP